MSQPFLLKQFNQLMKMNVTLRIFFYPYLLIKRFTKFLAALPFSKSAGR